MNHPNLWVLLANGSHAKIVITPTDYNIQSIQVIPSDNVKSRDTHSDKAGRRFTPNGNQRSSLAWHTDPIRQKERIFAEELSVYLLQCMDNGLFDSLALIAAPRTLGDLRLAFPDRLHKRVVFDSAKDLTNTPDSEVGRAILGLLTTA